jgi:hypothetical protein
VVLTVVAGGLRELLGNRGEHLDELTLRVMVPISLPREDPGQALGNQDGWMVVPLPLGEPDAAARLQLIAAETAARKDKIHPQVGSGIFRFALAQRVFLRLFAHQRLMNVTATNAAARRCRCIRRSAVANRSPWCRSWRTSRLLWPRSPTPGSSP